MLIKGPWNTNKLESQLQRQQGTVRDYCGSEVGDKDCSGNFWHQDRCVPKVVERKTVERLQ
jgi:hypothetical protein